ncbi:hypothetical protein LCGC14_0097230 [marine sediment metagenome]|uniref:Uncharacterized protein n=1 Tax=marine sediment metagenome TaxID=412755 RepID=A0A0F9VGZ8_9ZZZZ|nr:hypothetical protein [Halomonas sp.]HDZ45608.1 hypothetical protein [Halomonas sp.]HEB06928.1 hypothetical protein [Halomonas sp.]
MDTTTLQLWSVIGTWVAGIGTVGAVVTSLWFALHQNTIKLKVSAGHRILVTPGSKETPDYCSIQVVNVGLRPAKITHVGWEVGRWRNKKYMLQTFGYPGFDDVPKTLYEGEEASFMIPFLYSGGGEDWVVRFPKYIVGDGSPRLIKTLKVSVHTSVGQSFKRKVERNLIDKIEESYKANNEMQPTQKARG